MNWNHLGGLTFFAIALAGTTAAQPAPLSCLLNAGVPPIVRAEGLAEFTGDFVLNCTGGTPTAPGADIPRVNIQVFLNTTITSRIVSGDSWSEALLMIDEPQPGSQVYCSPTESSTCSGANVFQGRRTAANAVTFYGIPVDPPGLVSTRVIRIGNIRANANQLGISSTLIPYQIVAFVSAPELNIASPQATIAFVAPVPAKEFSATKLVSTSLPCASFNREAAITPGAPLSNGLTSVLKFRESFASAFHKRSLTNGDADTDPTPADQNFPGFPPLSESFFYNSSAPSANGLNQAGLATQGTRLVARFSNVPEGVDLFATLYPVTTCANCGPNGGAAITGYATTPPFDPFSARFARLVANADGPFAAVPGTNAFRWGAALENETPNGVARIPVVKGSAVAVWEVTRDVFFMYDTLQFGIGMAYKNVPGAVTTLVTGAFGPTGSTASVPRFNDPGVTVEFFTAQRGSSECRVNP